MKFSHLLISLVLVIMWSTDFLVAKHLSNHYPIFALMAAKFMTCAMLILPFRHKAIVPIYHIVPMSFIYTIAHVGAWMLSIRMGIYLSTLSFIEMLATPITIVMGVIFLRERMSLVAVVGILLALAGASLVILRPDVDGVTQSIWGIIAALVSTFAWSIYNMYASNMSRRFENMDYLALTGWIFLFGCPFAATLSFIFEPQAISGLTVPGAFDTLTICYTLVSTVAFQYLLLFLLRHHAMSKVSLFLLLTPFVSSVIAYFALNEPLGLTLVVGGIVVCAGVATATMGTFARDTEVATTIS